MLFPEKPRLIRKLKKPKVSCKKYAATKAKKTRHKLTNQNDPGAP